jgi:ATP-dependent helicase/nuclease subunit A
MKVKFDIPYTNEQITAITEYGKNIIVSAGAGSGKTQVLTERVSYFIKYHGIRLNEFLILTFTNLAAGEMKERIRKKLTKEGLPDALMVDTSYICTFDSFALALVKQYHYLLNLTPNVSIVDSNIISVRKRTIISDLFEELYYKKNEKFLKVIDLFCFKDDEDIQDLVFKLYAKAESSISETFYLNNFIDNYYNESLIKEVINIYLNKLLNIKEELKKLLVNLPDCYLNTKSKDTYYSFVNERFNSFINSESYDELISSFPLELGCKKPSKAPEDDKEQIYKT